MRDRESSVSILQALGLVLYIIVAEYFARRFVAAWIPTFGTPMTNDMIGLGLCYGVLLLLTTRKHDLLAKSMREMSGQNVAIWTAIFLGVGNLSLIDQLLWGHVQLPELNGLPNPQLILPQAGLALTVISTLLVNGLLVPVVEERLWRGLIQPRFVGGLGLTTGLVVTALLFSVKHAIVDASLGRLLAIFAGGMVLGYIASHGSWKNSALIHVLGNTIATIIGLLLLGKP